jgi:mannose-6-phosphate isomerase-like protein (cupin superfamily)
MTGPAGHQLGNHQQPHEDDEVYVVLEGSSALDIGGEQS